MDTEWQLINMAGADIPPQIEITLLFTSDQTVAGSAGCNTFRGNYLAEGTDLEFGPLASTRMACEWPVMTYETAYLQALDEVHSWVLIDGRLQLAGPTDVRPLIFVATR